MRVSHEFRPGDLVVYRKTKHAAKPGPRAEQITPARHGDNYTYIVDKYWVVDHVCEDGDVVLRTRRGKTHKTRPDDPNLRLAGLIARLLNGHRFPAPQAPAQRQQDQSQRQPTPSL